MRQSIGKIPLVKAEFTNAQIIVSETESTSLELVENLINVSNTSSIQTTLPISLFDSQINQLVKMPYSMDALNKLADLHNVKVDQLRTAIRYRQMPIPPFTNILLSQINSISEIPGKLIQLRADFQELREKFIDLEKSVFEAPTLVAQFEAQKSFDEFWSVFNKKYLGVRSRLFYSHLDIFNDTNLDNATNDVLTGDGITEGLKDVNYGKIIGKAISSAWTWNKDRKVINRFKGLTNIWNLFEGSKGILEQLPHFERVFKVKFESHQLQRVHDYVTQMKTVPLA